MQYLSSYYDEETLEKLKYVKPTSWVTAKTEAIDFDSDFYWLDDYVFNFEREILGGLGPTDRLIEVQLKYENELKHIKELLESKQSDERKYLFLDLDGVLNTGRFSNYLEENNLPQFDNDGAIFDPVAVENLQYIIDKTHAEIVLTSTWRYDGYDKMYQMWKNRNLPSVLIDITPDLFIHGKKRAKGFRGLEIDNWLTHGRKSNSHVNYSYAILDDEDVYNNIKGGNFADGAIAFIRGSADAINGEESGSGDDWIIYVILGGFAAMGIIIAVAAKFAPKTVGQAANQIPSKNQSNYKGSKPYGSGRYGSVGRGGGFGGSTGGSRGGR
jgi:hypothetical protein